MIARSNDVENKPEQFWQHVQKTSTCWLWTQGIYKSGHGMYSLNTKHVRAHRVAWELTVGPIPPGLLVCHKCDVPGCVNPAHLFIGTHADNNRDMKEKGRARNGSRTHPERVRRGNDHHWAKLTDTDVRQIRALRSAGVRVCDLGRQFNCSQPTICDIVKRRNWKHVE